MRVSRYGSAATLELDGGEGRRFNETFSFEGHQWLLVDKQEGVYAGGKAEYTGVRTFEVYADYQKGKLLYRDGTFTERLVACYIYFTINIISNKIYKNWNIFIYISRFW